MKSVAARVGEIGEQLVRMVVIQLLKLVSRSTARRLGGFIFDQATNTNSADMYVNGEGYFVKALAKQHGGAPVTILDVGGHHGEWASMALSAFAAIPVELFTFEPAKKNCAILRANFSSTRPNQKVTVLQRALSNRTGELILQLTGPESGSNSLYVRHAESIGIKGTGVEAVQVSRGDDVCREQGVLRIDLLKIDTEGSEMDVLEGFKELFSRQAIDWVQFEYSSGWIDARRFLLDAWQFFAPLGYRLGKQFPDGILWLDQYDVMLEDFGYCNYIAMSPKAPKISLGPNIRL